jgi:hypothetical protein
VFSTLLASSEGVNCALGHANGPRLGEVGAARSPTGA